MKFALINPGYNQDLQFPLGIAYIASYARKYGKYEPFMVDENSGQKSQDFQGKNPELIGVTSTTTVFSQAIQAIKNAKQVFGDIPVIIGGIHATSLPKETLENHLEIDIAVIGEGEQTMLELLDLYSEKSEFRAKELKKIDGIAFREENKIAITPSRQFIQHLDEVPFPARDLLPIKEFYTQPRAVIRGILKRTAQIISSRGCPYDCAFCASAKMWKRQFRFFSPEYVIKEIEHLIKDFGITALYFVDDTLTINKERVKRICDLIIEKKLNEKIVWSCQMRANLVDEETVRTVKEAGCIQAEFGFESGCERTLARIKGGNVTVRQNAEAIRACKKHGLRVLGNYVIGNPGEKKKEILETFNFIKQNKIDFVHPHIATPFPGSAYWNHAVQEGLVNKRMDWKRFQMSRLMDNIVLDEELPKEELFAIYTEMLKFASENNKEALMVGGAREFLNFKTIKRIARTPSHLIKYGPRLLKNLILKK